MRVVIQSNYDGVSAWAADYIVKTLLSHHEPRPFVLGLPTGSSPVGVYRRLAAYHREGKVSFANVATFNMDEYLGLPDAHPQSYHTFMQDNLFKHIDIPRESIHFLSGMASDADAECRAYEEQLAACGGVDLFLSGVGADGHIAFNEPFTSLVSRSGRRFLTADTRGANARFFGGDPSKVPACALSVGVGTIMDAKQVLLIVSGAEKASALQHTLEGAISHAWTCSALQLHPQVVVVCDEAACGELKVSTYRYFKSIQEQLTAEARV